MSFADKHEDAYLTMDEPEAVGKQKEKGEITVDDLGEGVVEDDGLGEEFMGGFDVISPAEIKRDLALSDLMARVSHSQNADGTYFSE